MNHARSLYWQPQQQHIISFFFASLQPCPTIRSRQRKLHEAAGERKEANYNELVGTPLKWTFCIHSVWANHRFALCCWLNKLCFLWCGICHCLRQVSNMIGGFKAIMTVLALSAKEYRSSRPLINFMVLLPWKAGSLLLWKQGPGLPRSQFDLPFNPRKRGN